MSKQQATIEQAALMIADQVLTCAAEATQNIEKEVLSKSRSFLQRVFSSKATTSDWERLRLNSDLVIPHVAVAEYKIENEPSFTKRTEEVATAVRQLCLEAIFASFTESGHGIVDADSFIKERTERFVIYAATAGSIGNVGEEVMKDHELPHRMRVEDVLKFLSKARIKTYKEIWAADEKRINQAGFIAELPQRAYEYWRGENPQNMETIQFNILLYLSLTKLNGLMDVILSSLEVNESPSFSVWENKSLKIEKARLKNATNEILADGVEGYADEGGEGWLTINKGTNGYYSITESTRYTLELANESKVGIEFTLIPYQQMEVADKIAVRFRRLD